METTPLPRALYRAGQVRDLDRYCIEQCGIPGIELMRRAGAAAFSLLPLRWPEAKRIHVLCGGGNNGGDGYVVAQLARQAAYSVSLWAANTIDELKGDARTAAHDFCADGGVIQPLEAFDPTAGDLIVDALLGTGLSSDVRGQYAAAIRKLSGSVSPVLAIDVPSGLHADTGAIMGDAVQAEATMTFIGVKQGLLTADGPDCAGALYFDDLGAPSTAYDAVGPAVRRLMRTDTGQVLRDRMLNCHKGQFGHVAVVGGDAGMPGAPRLAGAAALRCGAGMVTVATHPSHADLVTVSQPELMACRIEAGGSFEELLDSATVAAIGPGLGRSPWSSETFVQAMRAGVAKVIDADGLHWLAHFGKPISEAVLTPHPGEAAMLLDTDTASVQADRFNAALEIAEKFDAVCVLKGAGTIIASSSAGLRLCRFGNPAMATAGMGDTLTGVIAALLAQNVAPDDAADAGVLLHALAGDAAAAGGQRGMLASDLLPHLRRLVS